MYKVLKNLKWCGKVLLEGMFYDFPEATRPEQLDALVKSGLIEKAPEPTKAAPVAAKKKVK